MKLLLIDDKDIDRMQVLQLVEAAYPDAEIVVAGSHAAYLQALRDQGYELVLTEFDLEWAPGLLVLEALRSRWPHMPVIVVTGSGSEVVAVEAFRAGVTDYIRKDRPGELIPAIQRAIALGRADSDPPEALVRALELERGRLAAVLDHLPVGIWIADETGQLVGKNEEADRIWAGDAPLAESIEGYPQYEAWDAETGERLQPEDYPVARALRSGQAVDSVELRIRRFDGTEGVVLVSATPIKDSQGAVTGVVGINVDITERKRAEEVSRAMAANLAAEQSRLEAVLDALPVAVFIADAEGRLVTMNDLVYEVWGQNALPAESSAEYDAYRGWWPDSGEALAAEDWGLARALSRGETSKAEVIDIERFDGTCGTILNAAAPIRDAQGGIIGGVAVSQDISARRRIETALQESRQQLAAELEAARRLHEISTQLIRVDEIEVLYEQILDAAVAVLRADSASLQLWRSDVGARGALQLLGHRGFSPEAAAFWAWVYPGSSSVCGLAWRTGHRAFVPDVEQCESLAGSEDLAMQLQTGIRSVQSTPLVSRSGEMLGVISTHWRDIHAPTEGELRTLDVLARLAADLIERKQAETRLTQYMAELQEANQANRILLQEVNHRVKNNLTAILGLIMREQVRLDAEMPDHDETAHYLVALDSLSTRVRSLATVHQLLSASGWRPLEVTELARSVIDASVLASGATGSRATVHVGGAGIRLMPEHAHNLALVLGELTTNTLKYGSSEDCVRISVDVAVQNGEVQLLYRDAGPGYSESTLAGGNRSTGLDLVHSVITHSMRGSWSLRNEDGAVAELHFPTHVSLNKEAVYG